MKKTFLTVLFTAMIIMSVNIFVFAENREEKISAIDLIVTVTDELNVLTRSVSPSNPALEILNAEAIEIQNSYIQNNVYLNAFPDDLTYEILVTATDINNSEAKNFSELKASDFTEYCDKLTAEYEAAQNEELLTIDIYENGTTKYVYTYAHSTANNVSSYVAKYYTVMNGRNYNFMLQTNDLEINDIMSGQLKSLVDSAQYTEVEASLAESGLFMEVYETLIGFALTILILGVVLFMSIHSSKKHH